MFTTITHFEEGIGDEFNRIFKKYEDFETAENAGMHDACLNVVNHVIIMDAEGKMCASWDAIDNFWITYKDDKGNFITPRKYFEKSLNRTQKYAFENDFNIRIKKTGYKIRVHAGKHVIPLEARMLPWVREAIDQAQLKSWREEDRGNGSLSPEVLLDLFAEHLIERIKFGLDRNKSNWTWLRRSPLFK